MTNWNPNANGTLGLEWFPHSEGVYNVDSQLKCIGTSFLQSVGQTIGAVRIPNNALPQRGGLYAVEVYDNESAVAGNAASLLALPNEDVSGMGFGTGQWREESGALATTIYTQIDDSEDVEYIYNGGGGGNTPYVGRMNTATLSLTGKRILSVSLIAHVARAFVDNNTQILLGLNLGGTNYYSDPFSVPYGGAHSTITKTWNYNPATKRPWTIAEVQALDSTDEWFIQGSSTPDGNVTVFWVHLNVAVCDETRIAVGTLDDTASALTPNAWNAAANMLTPVGGAWTKDAAGRHLYTVRRMNDIGSMSVPFVDSSPNTCPVASGWLPTLDADLGYVTAMGTDTMRIMPVVQRTTAPAESVDSIPYWHVRDALVATGRTTQQEFTGAANTYGGMKLLVRYAPAAPPTADLTVQVRRRSDNVAMGSALTITRAEVDALANYGVIGSNNGYWKSIARQIATAVLLAAGTQYYVEFVSTTPVANAWSVALLHTGNDGNTATFNGTTDRGTDGVLGEQDYLEIPFTFSTVPTAPAGFTATLGSQTIGETICCVTAIARADLAWTATALGGSWARYELQRSEDAGATWVDLATISSAEAVATFKDYEARRGVAATYRIRSVRTDGAVSPWATSASVTKPLNANSVLELVSNYSPSLNLGYDYRPGKSYDFHEADEQVMRATYQRDYQVGFQPTEYRGATANYVLILGVDDKVPPGGGLGIGAFAPLRALARARVPYVCVLDHRGNRLFAMLRVPSGDESQPAALYIAPLAATEVTATPFAVVA